MGALVAESLSQVRPVRLNWLWDRYLPRGKLAVLDGDPGVGKSLLTIDLAARLSRGEPLPDGTPSGRPHVVVLLNAEDDAADTVHPRAEAAGADLDRVVVVTAPAGAPPRFPDALPELEGLILARAADLVVIDPFLAFLPPNIAATADQSVRRVLDALARVAARTDCAVLLVRHLRKAGGAKAVYRGLGSIAIAGVARATLLAGRHPSDPTLGVLAVPKSNYTGSVPALGYRVAAAAAGAVVEWAGPTDVGADDLGKPAEPPLRPRDRATEWLRAELAAGPRPAAALQAAATAAHIPEATLRRAKADLGVQSHQVRRAGAGEWYWYDPDAPWPKTAPFQKPWALPPLEALM